MKEKLFKSFDLLTYSEIKYPKNNKQFINTNILHVEYVDAVNYFN